MLSARFFALAAFVALAIAQGDLQDSLDLDPSQVQPNQNNNGQDVPDAGQVPSQTSVNNFINFCATQSGVSLTNGQQIQDGSCNPTPMGRIIATSNMPRSKFVFPANGDASLVENQPFVIQMAIENLVSGNFVNPNTNYYAAPATVDDSGILIGHSHVVVQALTSLDQTTIPDPNTFVFFKGLNEAADAKGILSTNVTAGLPAGAYRMSSINAAMNHQPALVAVAQHGSLDDFVYFTVNPAGGAPAPPAASAPAADPAAPPADPAAPPADPAAPPADPAAPPAADPAAPPADPAAPAAPPAADPAAPPAAPAPPAASAASSAAAPAATNFQAFQGSLGGIKANAVNDDPSGAGFVTGGQTFVQKDDALVNSCNLQRNACSDNANAVNGAGGVTITACDLQQQDCLALATPPPDAGSKNLQPFTGTLGGIFAPPVLPSNGSFITSGKVIPGIKDALLLSCNVQRNLCADKANAVNGANGVTIDACDQQLATCTQAAQ